MILALVGESASGKTMQMSPIQILLITLKSHKDCYSFHLIIA